MVCKKSLYCWKNGPCASFQTRKKIWEDNIKFRESLRNVNQSDHYWSFQISKNLCLCQDNEDLFCRKPLGSTSIQNLHENDCTSIAHDCNGLKYRNCLVHCPLQFHNYKVIESEDNARTGELTIKKQDKLNCRPNQCQFLEKLSHNKSESSSRRKNISAGPTLKPNMEKKFASQSNLNVIDDLKLSTDMSKKSLNLSCEAIEKSSNNKCNDYLNSTKILPVQLNFRNKDSNKIVLDLRKEKIKCKNAKELSPPVQFMKDEKFCRCHAPLSRTTRKILIGNKRAPFLPSGCTTSSNDIGAKKTHNVLASKLEVYPNALSAKEQKQKLILKNMQYEKEFQKKFFPDQLKKEMINHSSLWSREPAGKETRLLQQKNSKKIFPTLYRNTKNICAVKFQVNSRLVKTNKKPQIYFY